MLWVLGLVFLFSWLTYLVPQLLLKFRKPQNLKLKYGASWALVTGGSSGIGRAVVERLAGQELNIVIVAYPDDVFSKAIKELQETFPNVKIVGVGLDMSSRDFMAKLIEETKAYDIQVVVNNAGFIKTGFFTDVAWRGQLANHDVNATASAEITHHYVSEMRKKKLPGCVTFTSSPAGFMPCPFSVMYGATKAYLTTFAQSLAPEIRSDGIDVTVVHPSPVASRFYEGAHQIDALVFFKSTATGPERIADTLLAAVGRSVTVDQGYYPICVKLLLRIVDVNFMADAIARFAHFMPDFKAMKKSDEGKKSQ